MKILLLFLILFHISFAKAEAEEEITVVTENWPPYNYLDKDGNLVGNSTTIVNKILSDAKIQLKY